MANDVLLGKVLATRPVQGGRAPTTATDASGKLKPQIHAGGKSPPQAAVSAQPQKPEQASSKQDLTALAERLGRYLRESGRPISFKVQSEGGRTVVQEIDPDSGEIIAEITPENLMSLARGLGLSGTLVNSRA